ncbi:MAG: Do family serine endopeptidase [Flavobacteriales bacterium]|nr:Do family serine endopeptidase [Flavobacteriales bacterium]
MKKISSLILASVIGSMITFGVFYSFDVFDGKTLKIEHISSTGGNGAVLAMDKKGDLRPLDFTDIADKVMHSVVHIRSTQTGAIADQISQGQLPDPFKRFFKNGPFDDLFGPKYHFESPRVQKMPNLKMGSGSGVIINDEGYIVTNYHVIKDADDIEVTLNDNRTYKASVMGTDPSTDLALIQIKEKDLTALPMVNSDDVEVGDWVLAVGNPFNLNSTVTAGIVSAKARNINILKDRSAIESFIQTDAAINPGNSGGALVNLQGGLIGINTAISSPTGAYAGYGFAVPSNMVNKVVEDLLKYGVVQRGYLGVTIRGLDGNLAKVKDLELTEGVYIDSLMENSAAQKAGLLAGDVILKANGIDVRSAPELQEVIARYRPGDTVDLLIDRKGKEKEYEVKLKNKEGNSELIEKENTDMLVLLGVELEDLDKETSRKLDIEGGVKVKKLHAGKLKRHTGMKDGFIITKVGGERLKDKDQLIDILENTNGGVMLEGFYEDYPGVYYYAFGL